MSARMLGPEGGGLRDLTSVGEGNEIFFIRVWKPLPSTRVSKTLRESPKKTISVSSGAWAITNGINARHRAMCQ